MPPRLPMGGLRHGVVANPPLRGLTHYAHRFRRRVERLGRLFVIVQTTGRPAFGWGEVRDETSLSSRPPAGSPRVGRVGV